MKKVKIIEDGFVTEYIEHLYISYSEVNYQKSTVFVHFISGEAYTVECSLLDSYQMQFGITVSDNGEFVFVQEMTPFIRVIHAQEKQ